MEEKVQRILFWSWHEKKNNHDTKSIIHEEIGI